MFTIPARLERLLDRDLRLAGIPKRDERGRTIDVHALRHTFGTLLSKDGVAPRTAQAAMRHSDIKLTMNVYTDPALLDVRGALDVLPTVATGTDLAILDRNVRLLAPTLAPTSDNQGQPPSISVHSNTDAHSDTLAVSGESVNRKGRLSSPDNRPSCRGDRTPLELFLAGVRGWDAGLRRRIENESSVHQ